MKKLLKIAILSISLLTVMSGAAISPALGNISETFGDTNILLIKMILTIPAILIIPFSLLTGKLVEIYKKKTLLILGLVVYVFGGIGGGFATNIYVLLFFRALLGVGVGLIMPLSTGLIADFYEKDERAKMMGYSSAVNQLGSMIATILSGIVATINWRLSFGVYAIGMITLVLTIIVISEPESKVVPKKTKVTVNKGLLKLMLAMAVVNIVFYTVPTTMSIFIQSENLGDASIVGYILAIINVLAFAVGIMFTKIISILKNKIVIVSGGALLIGYILLSSASSVIVLSLSMVFIGIGLGILLPLIFFTTSERTAPENSTFALACVSSSMFLGQFLSPILVDLLSNMMGSTSIRFAFQFSAVLCLIGIISYYFIGKRDEVSYVR